MPCSKCVQKVSVKPKKCQNCNQNKFISMQWCFSKEKNHKSCEEAH